MNSFISLFLEENKKELEHILDSDNGNICELSNFTFDNGFIPDYKNSIYRNIYFLRYAYAYIIEYYIVFNKFFNDDKINNLSSISLLSLGCGGMLDLVGFNYARINNEKYKTSTPYYYGVDLIDWNCKNTKIIENTKFFNCNIDEFDINSVDDPIDIIIFPKSISEISNDCIDKFVNNISCDKLSKKLCIINSRRGSSVTDANKAEYFSSCIKEKCNYSSGDYIYFDIDKDNEVYLGELVNCGFREDVKQWMINLTTRYCLFGECTHEQVQECSKVIDKWPLLKARNISPQIYYLEK